MTVHVRIESVFDIALGKLLLDNLEDVALVSVNKEMMNALNIPENNLPHDVHIADLDKRAGIIIKGISSVVTSIKDLFKQKIPDCISFSHDIQQDAIYLGVVDRYIFRKKLAIVNLGDNEKGILFNVKCHEGDRILVQIKELTTETEKLPVCSSIITLSGTYVILEEGGNFVRVSRKIRGDDRKRYHDLGRELQPEGFGIILRTSVLGVSDDDIKYEIDNLMQMWNRTEDEATERDNPGRLISGELVTEISFSFSSKQYFDQLRGEIMPTIENFYHYKAYSMASGFSLDLLQQFIEKLDQKEISNEISTMVRTKDYPLKNHVKAEFYYLNGTNEEIILGDLVENKDVLRVKKILDYAEEYPIFQTRPNDRVEVTFKPGCWTIHYRYFSNNTNEMIGERVHLITPLDLVFRGRIRAFDMGISLYKNREGDSSVINTNTSNLVEKGLISASLDKKLGDVLQSAMDQFNNTNNDVIISLN